MGTDGVTGESCGNGFGGEVFIKDTSDCKVQGPTRRILGHSLDHVIRFSRILRCNSLTHLKLLFLFR